MPSTIDHNGNISNNYIIIISSFTRRVRQKKRSHQKGLCMNVARACSKRTTHVIFPATNEHPPPLTILPFHAPHPAVANYLLAQRLSILALALALLPTTSRSAQPYPVVSSSASHQPHHHQQHHHRPPDTASCCHTHAETSTVQSRALILHRRTRHSHGSGSHFAPLQAFCIPLCTAARRDRAIVPATLHLRSRFPGSHAQPTPSCYRRLTTLSVLRRTRPRYFDVRYPATCRPRCTSGAIGKAIARLTSDESRSAAGERSVGLTVSRENCL